MTHYLRTLRRTAPIIGFGLLTLLTLRTLWGNLTPRVVVPPQANPPHNSYARFLQIAQKADTDRYRIRAAVSLRPENTKAWDLARRRRLRNAHQAELTAARDMLTRPYSDLGGPRSHDRNIKMYTKFSTLSLLLLLDGDMKRDQGDLPGAAQSYTDAVIFGRVFAKGAPFMGWEAAQSCQAAGQRRLWKILPRMEAQTARTVLRRLSGPHLSGAEGAAQSLAEDKYTVQTELAAFFAEYPLSFTYAVWGKTTMMNNGTNYVDALTASTRQPFALHEETPLPRDLLTPFLLPLLDKAHWKSAASDTQNALLTTALAVQAFRREHSGAAPQNLTDLVPAYLPSVPVDPLAYPAAPLSYRTNADKTTTLWSVGPDNVQNNGTPTRDYPPTSGPAEGDGVFITTAESKGDMVAGVNTRIW